MLALESTRCVSGALAVQNAGHCIYGATDIVSPREFLSQLEELGRQRN